MVSISDGLEPLPELSHPSQSKRLRIGMVAPALLPVPPIGYGGIERVVAVLVEGLVADGHDVTLFAAASSITTAHLVSSVPRPLRLGDPASLADEIYHNAVAYRHVEEFDVIHDHTGVGPAFGAVAAGSTPVIHTLHGQWTPYSRRLCELVDNRVHMVAISQAQRAANVSARYTDVIYNGVDLKVHPFQPIKEDFLVFVGRISSEKRPEVAIDVARAAGLPLVMIIKMTEPAERAYFDESVAPRLGDDITILEEPPHAVKVDVLGRARALLFPIDWPEPFGLVMTEAMACGTPVIARPLGAAPEIVIDGVTGLLCSTMSQMVDAVGATLDLNAEDCRSRVERYFSAEVMVAGYERVYRDAIKDAATTEERVVLGPHLSLSRYEHDAWRQGA